MKLTPAQQRVLDELRKPGVVAHYMPYMGNFNPDPYWVLSGSMKRCTKQVEALIKLGLVRETHRDWRGATAKAVKVQEATP